MSFQYLCRMTAAAQTVSSQMDERRTLRTPVAIEATLCCDKAPTQRVRVADFSHFGCRVAISRRVSVGTFVTLCVPSFVEIFGWIAWTTDEAAGIDFSHPLPEAVAGHVVKLGLMSSRCVLPDQASRYSPPSTDQPGER